MKPIIKYRGGKGKEIPEFLKFIPPDYNRYIEPFLGGGAVFFFLEPKEAVINDINGRLMTFYQQVRDDYIPLSRELGSLQEQYEKNQRTYAALKASEPDPSLRVENCNEALYYRLRDMYNHLEPSEYTEGTLYYFINKTAYSGMIRFNRQGEYNVPFGRYAHFNTEIITPQHSRLLRGARLFHTDYSEIFGMAGEEDFMFLDPPYNCIFNDYGNLDMEKGFDEEQHRRLAADFRNLNCRALMVIGRTELTQELYGNNIVHEYEKKYAVNIRNRFRANASHIVVANYRI